MRILLIEDNKDDTLLIREKLAQAPGPSFDLRCEEKLETGLERLASEQIDVVLLDLCLPDSHGIGTFLKTHARAPEVAIVILTGHQDEKMAVNAVRGGAQDYLVKDHVDTHLLVRAVRHAAERKKVAEELRVAKEEADAANRLKSSFLANMSHEIRTPVAAIVGYTELLRDHVAEGDVVALEYLKTVEQSGQHLVQLINDILDLSKIEASQMSVKPTQCRPAEILEDVLATMSFRVIEKGIALTDHYETKIPETIISDPTRLRQVLLNLIGNAIKFTESGSVAVSVRFLESQRGSKKLEFRVKDTGIGIPESRLNDIFKPFSQVDSSYTRDYGGTGLGLSISSQLARLLDGELTVTSQLGIGSVFVFTISCEVPDGTPMLQTPKAQSIDSGGSAPRPDGTKLSARIFLVEDRPENQRVIRCQLESDGATVEIADNGAQAIENYAEGKFDLIIMDLQMPVMDGFDALAELRKRGTSIPVIALTAQAMAGDKKRCLDAGFDAYLTKPVRKAELVNTITDLLGNRSVAVAATRRPGAQ